MNSSNVPHPPPRRYVVASGRIRHGERVTRALLTFAHRIGAARVECVLRDEAASTAPATPAPVSAVPPPSSPR